MKIKKYLNNKTPNCQEQNIKMPLQGSKWDH